MSAVIRQSSAQWAIFNDTAEWSLIWLPRPREQRDKWDQRGCAQNQQWRPWERVSSPFHSKCKCPCTPKSFAGRNGAGSSAFQAIQTFSVVRAFRGSKGANTADPQQDLKISDLRFQKIAEFNTEETEGAEKREL